MSEFCTAVYDVFWWCLIEAYTQKIVTTRTGTPMTKASTVRDCIHSCQSPIRNADTQSARTPRRQSDNYSRLALSSGNSLTLTNIVSGAHVAMPAQASSRMLISGPPHMPFLGAMAKSILFSRTSRNVGNAPRAISTACCTLPKYV